MTFDGTHLHISDLVDDNIRVIAPDTADGQAATVVLRTYTVSGLNNPTAMAFDGTNLHVADVLDDNIRVIAPDTADGQAATVLRTYTVSGLNAPTAITFDGTNLHVGDATDGNFRVIAPDTANNQQATILRTYTVSGLSVPSAMAFVSDPQATITLSTTDTDIRAGDTVAIDIDSTIDITLTDANITVTGGTRGTLTGSGQSYALSVTAGDAGTLTVSIAEDAVPEGNAAASVDFTITANYQLHIADGSNDNISVIGYDTADGDTADALRTYTTTDSTDVQSIVYDGTHIHITNWQQSTVRVYAINLSGVSPVVRSYTVTGISQPSGMAFDGTHLHIADRAMTTISV